MPEINTWASSSIWPAACGVMVLPAARLLAIAPAGNGEDEAGGGDLLGPDGFELPLHDLEQEGVQLVLVGELAPGDELHGPEGGHHVRVGKRGPELLGGPGLGPLEGVGDDLDVRVRFGSVVVPLLPEPGLALLEELLGPGVLHL